MILVRLAAALLLAVLAAPAPAHETTRSYLAIDRDGADLALRLRLAFRDVEVVAWMDEDLDGRITWGEAAARLDAATSYAAARLSIEAEAAGPCALRPAGAGASRSGGVDYLDLAFEAACPPGPSGPSGALRVGSTLFAEVDPDHRLFLTASDRGRETSAILGATDPTTVLAAGSGGGGAFAAYLLAGVEHLLAGPDHLLFLLVLVLPAARGPGPLAPRLGGVVAAVTGFTIAHALTLTAAATDLLRPPAALIEALVALSILVTAADNVRPFVPGPRAALAAFFGTIHGFGFATALSGLPLGSGDFVVALLGFNLGIELAQVGVALLALPALAMLGPGPAVVRIGSAAAAAAAVAWLWQRGPALAGLWPLAQAG